MFRVRLPQKRQLELLHGILLWIAFPGLANSEILPAIPLNVRFPSYRKFYQGPFVTCTEQKCDLSEIISKCLLVKILTSHSSYTCSFSSCCTTRSQTFPYFPMYPEGQFVISSPVLFCANCVSHSQSLTYTICTRVNQFIFIYRVIH